MRRNYLKVLLIAVVMVISIGIAYAALSATLTVTTNSVKQSVYTWSHTMTCTKTNDVGTSDTGRSCGAVRTSTNGTTAVIIEETTLSKPDDACVYKCTISNAGTIPSKITGIVPTKPSSTTCTTTSAGASATASMVCGNITYGIYSSVTASAVKITAKSNQTVPTAGISLAAGGNMDVYLVAEYTGTSLATSAVTQSNGKFTFNIAQN